METYAPVHGGLPGLFLRRLQDSLVFDPLIPGPCLEIVRQARTACLHTSSRRLRCPAERLAENVAPSSLPELGSDVLGDFFPGYRRFWVGSMLFQPLS